jgi:hypothetical protein
MVGVGAMLNETLLCGFAALREIFGALSVHAHRLWFRASIADGPRIKSGVTKDIAVEVGGCGAFLVEQLPYIWFRMNSSSDT